MQGKILEPFVAINKDGKIVFSKAYGLAQSEEKIKVTDETNFRVSIG